MEEQEQHLLKQNYVTNDKVKKPQYSSGDKAAPKSSNNSSRDIKIVVDSTDVVQSTKDTNVGLSAKPDATDRVTNELGKSLIKLEVCDSDRPRVISRKNIKK